MRPRQSSRDHRTKIVLCVFFVFWFCIPLIHAAAPTVDSLIVNSSLLSNITTKNLTAYVATTDTDGDNVSIAYDWRRNGTSIAVVNLNFDVNNSGGTNIMKDYSRTLNNGTAKIDSGSAGCSAYGWNATAGRNGTGAMRFCASTNFAVNMSSPPNITRNFTFEMWIYVSNYTDGLVTNGLGSTFVDRTTATTPIASLKAVSGNYAFQYRNDSGVAAAALTGDAIVLNTWQHIVWGRNSGTELFIYVDGVKTTTTDVGGILTLPIPKIGKHVSNSNTGFNGTIDEFRIYNRTLSHEEIMTLYRNETNRIVRKELSANDNWTVCVTPNDGTQDGTAVCSDTLLINENQVPSVSTITITSADGTNASNIDLIASFSITNTEGDDIENATDWRRNGTSIAVVNMNFDVENSNGTGSVRSYSSYATNASVNGSLWVESGGHRGTGAYSFDGTDDSMTIPHSASVNFTNTITISAWVYPSDSAAEYDKIVVKAWNSDIDPYNAFSLQRNSSTQAYAFGVTTNGAWGGSISTSQAPLNTWTHIVGRYNGTHTAIFFNGQQEDADAKTGAINTSTRAVTIGYNPYLREHFNGRIDELFIFNRSLSNDQITLLYENDISRLASSEIAQGENWTVCITPNDVGSQGATACSTGILITRETPVMNSSRITPTPTANATDDIIGYCNATSPDGYLVVYEYTWYKTNATDTNVTIQQGIAFSEGSIDASTNHVCGIRANDSRVLCWGYNGYGQLGNGSTATPGLRPQLINDTSAYKQVSVGGDHTCGIRANDSRVLCWGRNDGGRLGNGSSNNGNGLNPRVITDTSAYANISAGGEHTCGIRASDGRVLCWGVNTNGEIGDGTLINRNVSTLTLDTSRYKQVSTGQDHSCGINATTGRVMCWGSNSFGVLGTGNGSAAIPRPTAMRNTSAFLQISAGTFHSCGIRSTDGRVLCWGINQNGEGGNGSSGGGVNSLNATFTNDTSPYVKIAAGNAVSCGIRANDSRVLCWGEDGLGGNGDGSAGTDNLIPTLTSDTNPQTQIVVGYQGGCAVRTNDTRVLCWGYNALGAVGIGSTASPQVNPILTTDSSAYYLGFVSGTEALVSQLNNTLIRSGDNITLSCRGSDGAYGVPLTSNTTSIIDSCILPSMNTNWVVYAADNCTVHSTSIDLGTGNLTVSGEHGPGHLRLNATNVTANNVNVIGNGNLTRIIIENSGRVAIS